MSHSLSCKVQFLFVVLLGSLSTVKLNGHSSQGWRGKVLSCSTIQKKRLKAASFSDQGVLAGIFNRESWAQGITENSLRAARLLRSGLRLLWGQSLLERAKVPRECSVSSTKGWFSHSLNMPSSWLPPCQHCCCSLERVVVIWCSNWETRQCLVSGPVLERAGRHGSSKPSSIRNWFGDLGRCFLGALQE